MSWAEDVEGTFRTTLQVVAKDRINLIVDISTVLSSTKTMCLHERPLHPRRFALTHLDQPTVSTQPAAENRHAPHRADFRRYAGHPPGG